MLCYLWVQWLSLTHYRNSTLKLCLAHRLWALAPCTKNCCLFSSHISNMSTTVTTNTLLSNVPKLDVTGKNWAIYQIWFTQAVQSKGVWGHLDGTTPCPTGTPAVVPPTTEGTDGEGGQPPAAPVIDTALLVTWQKDEALALDLLTQQIPNSTVIRTASQSTAAAMWTEIVHEYTEKGSYAQMDLWTKFLESKCPDKGDVHAWLGSLHVQKEELISSGWCGYWWKRFLLNYHFISPHIPLQICV